MAGQLSSAAAFLTSVLFVTAGAVIDESTSSLRRGAAGRDRAAGHHTLTLTTPQIKQQLVICNAYTSDKGLEVVQVRTDEKLTVPSPLKYKQCREFSLPLQEGDQFDFKAGDLLVGSFYATGLPRSSASLLLVPHRREPHSKSVKFESHAFSDMANPQIAVVDAYKGHESGAVKIIESHLADADAHGATGASEQTEEDLNFNSVVAVNPGKYQVALMGTSSNVKMPLNAKDKAKYVIMRVGNDASQEAGKQYSQELIVFPSPSSAHGNTQLSSVVLLATVVAVLISSISRS